MRSPVVLAIETATEVCGAAVADLDGVRAEAVIHAGLSHSSRLVELIGRVMADTSVRLADLDVLAVSVGPGSFTGIRIGLGVATGIAAGAGVPVVGVPTLDALAWSQMPFEGFVCPFIDARRGESYYCLYEASGYEISRKREYSVRPPAVMVAEIVTATEPCRGRQGLLFAGPASLLHVSGVNEEELKGAMTARPERSYPGPGPLATLGLRLHQDGKSGGLEFLKPIYVRRSDAELKGN